MEVFELIKQLAGAVPIVIVATPTITAAITARYSASSPELTPIFRTNGANVPNMSIATAIIIFAVFSFFIMHLWFTAMILFHYIIKGRKSK